MGNLNESKEIIKQKIEELIDYSTGLKLKNKILSMKYDEEKGVIELVIEVGQNNLNNDNILKRQIAKIVKIDHGFSGVKINFEETKKSDKIAGKNTKFILISGGKGGIGKTFITVNLAYALNKIGKKVGIIDADIYGASVPTMLAMFKDEISVGEFNKINPFKKWNMEIISTEFFSEYEKPIYWQGSSLYTMISNFLYQVAWSKDLDYILVDMPTGTGDVFLSIAKDLKDANVIIVSEEDMLSAHTALKSGVAHKELGQNLLGVVINKKTIDNFAEEYLTEKLGIPALAFIPYEKPKTRSYLYDENDENYKLFIDLATIIQSIL
ncbi:MAG: P-loop NTPase [Bacilli bacterium]|nr:P-loop NTPase [Bacilli bacterium]